MYSIELEHLNSQNALTAVLGTVEKLAQEYGLHNHFGTMSFALTELVTKLFETSVPFQQVDVQFVLDRDGISVDLHANQSCTALAAAMENKADDAVFAIENLTDKLACSADGHDIAVGFNVKPNFAIRHQPAEVQANSVRELF